MSNRLNKIASFLYDKSLDKEAARRKRLTAPAPKPLPAGEVKEWSRGESELPPDVLYDILEQEREAEARRSQTPPPVEPAEEELEALEEEPVEESFEEPIEEPVEEASEEPVETTPLPIDTSDERISEMINERYGENGLKIIRKEIIKAYKDRGPPGTEIPEEKIKYILTKILENNLPNLGAAIVYGRKSGATFALDNWRRKESSYRQVQRKKDRDRRDEQFEKLKKMIMNHHIKMRAEFNALVQPCMQDSGWSAGPNSNAQSILGKAQSWGLHAIWLTYLEGIIPDTGRVFEVYPDKNIDSAGKQMQRSRAVLTSAGASEHLMQYVVKQKGTRTQDFLGGRLYKALIDGDLSGEVEVAELSDEELSTLDDLVLANFSRWLDIRKFAFASKEL